MSAISDVNSAGGPPSYRFPNRPSDTPTIGIKQPTVQCRGRYVRPQSGNWQLATGNQSCSSHPLKKKKKELSRRQSLLIKSEERIEKSSGNGIQQQPIQEEEEKESS